jgi:hypothetical protein
MKLSVFIILFFSVFQFVYSQNPANSNCADAAIEFSRLNDSAVVYVKKKFYITANSYFKSAQQIKQLKDSCNIANEEASNLAVSIIAPATYQTLIENVYDLQDNANFEEAMNKYNIAGNYYSQFQISEFGLIHDSLVKFIFTKGTAGFAAWLSEFYLNQNKLDLSLVVHQQMLEKSNDYKALKRQSYDLGVKLAVRDKAKYPDENAKNNFTKYNLDKPIFKYLKMGYNYGWK